MNSSSIILKITSQTISLVSLSAFIKLKFHILPSFKRFTLFTTRTTSGVLVPTIAKSKVTETVFHVSGMGKILLVEEFWGVPLSYIDAVPVPLVFSQILLVTSNASNAATTFLNTTLVPTQTVKSVFLFRETKTT